MQTKLLYGIDFSSYLVWHLNKARTAWYCRKPESPATFVAQRVPHRGGTAWNLQARGENGWLDFGNHMTAERAKSYAATLCKES